MKLDAYKWAGISGLVFVFVAAIAAISRGLVDIYTWIPLAVGIAGMLAYLGRYWSEALAMVKSRKTRHGANALVMVLAVLAIFSFAQAIVSSNNSTWDLSKNKIHSLSDQTHKAITGLEQDILVYHFFLPSGSTGQIETFLKKVRGLNPSRFKFQMVNLNQEPMLAQQYSVRSSGTSVLVSGERSETFTGTKEEDLINALEKVVSSGTKVVYLLQGHQEIAMSGGEGSADSFKAAVENGSFLLRQLNILNSEAVPNDAAAVIVAGSRMDFAPVEIQRLKVYLAAGGRVLMALNPRVNAPLLKELVKTAGIDYQDDIVVDPIAALMGTQPIVPPGTDFDPNHPVTKDLARGQILFPLTRSMKIVEPAPDGVETTVLSRSTRNSWAHKGTGATIPSKPTEDDEPGPLVLAVAVEAPTDLFAGAQGEGKVGEKARLIVLGTARMISNESFGAFNNQDFVLNAVRWLSGDEKKISIAARDPENTPLILSQQQLVNMALACLVGFPGAALLMGFVVFFRRRKSA